MSAEPRRNPLRERVERGDPAFGVVDGLCHPAVVELCGELDYDFVWIDYEHGGPSPWDAERLGDLLRAADAAGTDLLVRLPSPDPALVRKALDAGVRNLFVSRVETAEQARRALAAAHFEYDGGPGERGLASPRASRWGLTADYPAVEDDAVFVGVTVETTRAVENIEGILSVPDLGFVFLGPQDLSVSVGAPGEVSHPEVRAAEETVLERCLDRNVPVGNLTFGMDDAREKVDDGYRILNVGSSTSALRDRFRDWQAEWRGD